MEWALTGRWEFSDLGVRAREAYVFGFSFPGEVLLMILSSCIALRTLNYGNYGIFLIMGDAGFVSSTVGLRSLAFGRVGCGMVLRVEGFPFPWAWGYMGVSEN